MAKSAFKFELTGMKELMNALEQLPTVSMQKGAIRNALKDAGQPVVQDAKAIVPVDSGHLRDSIKVSQSLKKSQRPRRFDRTSVTVYVGSTSPLCIFDAKTKVVIKNGYKQISCLKAGDEVLTQTGEYKKVVAVQSFPAIRKPNLVEITAVARGKGSAKTHKLTVTEDHKVLVFRDGRNKWVMAGQLLRTDKIYTRRKVAHNKATGKIIVCKNCGVERLSDGRFNRSRVYCSRQCRDEDFSRNNPHIGTQRSEAAKKKMSDAAIRKFKLNPESHPNRIMGKKGHKTEYEKRVEAWLIKRGINFTVQKQIGNVFVDFFVPETKTVYEADGAYWHKDQNADIARDKEILKSIPDAKIIHIHFFDKRHSPEKIDIMPLPNVHYVSCNPGPDSYTDPEQLETTEIVSIRRWQYEKSKKPHASAKAKVYDISVDGVHSFFANGLLVSNSHLIEFGTTKRVLKEPRIVTIGGRTVRITHTGQLSPRPFLRPAWDAKKDTVLKLLGDAIWVQIAKAARRLAKKAEKGTLTKTQIRGLNK